jgi:uncharacterized membrane protein SpoIIM required for sporulation
VNPLIFIAAWLLVCVAAFLVGLRFYRTKEPNGDISVAQARRFGRLLMMAASAMVLFAVAAFFHGDLAGLKAAKVLR